MEQRVRWWCTSSGRTSRCAIAMIKTRLTTARTGISHLELDRVESPSARWSGVLTRSSLDTLAVVLCSLVSLQCDRLCLRFSVCGDDDGEDFVRKCGVTHDASKTGDSHIDGMMSSGPDIDDADVCSESEPSFLFSFDGRCRGLGLGVSGSCCVFLGVGDDGTTQDSPRTALSWGRGEVDMGEM